MRKVLLRYNLLAFCLGTMQFSISQESEEIKNTSYVAFAVPEKDLLPESIAYDPAKETFYMGSTRKGKIIKIDKRGKISDFILQGENSLWMVIGLQIDPGKRLLWACSTGGDNLVGYNKKDEIDGRPSGIFKFDLDTGRLLQKYILNSEKEVHFFNDMAIAKDGTVYISHMFEEHAIYKIGEKDALEKVVDISDFPYPNGITLSEDDSRLFVAHSQGIARIDLKSKEIKSLDVPSEIKIARRESIDGLYYYNGSLIGIQPDIRKVQRFYLSSENDAITRAEVLELNHPMMDNPTTGEIVGDNFYYLANAQFGKFDENGLFPMDKLYEPIVLKVKLND
jgi:sugar lactone lactonase YvrE